MPVEWLVVGEEGRVGALGLLVQSLHRGWQQPVQAERGALLGAEGSALVEQGVREQSGAAGVGPD